MSGDRLPVEWYRRYRALEAEGLAFAEIIKRLNDEFPEQQPRNWEAPNRYIGPHAEQTDAEEH